MILGRERDRDSIWTTIKLTLFISECYKDSYAWSLLKHENLENSFCPKNAMQMNYSKEQIWINLHVLTQMMSMTKLSLHDGKLLSEPHTYKSMVGVLQYLVHTWLDIAFTINKLCQLLHQPTIIHCKQLSVFFTILRMQYFMDYSFYQQHPLLYMYTLMQIWPVVSTIIKVLVVMSYHRQSRSSPLLTIHWK